MDRRGFLTTGLGTGAAVIGAGVSPAAGQSREKVKIIGISCSPRKGKTTFKAMGACLQAAKQVSPKIETQLIELAGLDIRPCNACMECKKGLKCSIEDDFTDLIPVLADKTSPG